MLQALSIAATGMEAQETRIQVISNNLANAATPGFKVSRARFQDLLYLTPRQAGTQSSQTSFVPTGESIGLGTRTAAVDQIFTEGQLDNTGNPLDVALQGDGFFQISMPDGTISVQIQIGSQSTPTQVGQLQVVKFLNPAGLQPLGQNLYAQSQAAGAPQSGVAGQNGFATIAQGFLEMPNESTVQELVG